MTMHHLGGWESLDCDLRGHTTGHLLSAMAYLQMDAKADSLIRGLEAVQKHYGTGYLSAFGEGLIDRCMAGESVWAPFYTLHKLLQGLLDQYTLRGNERALKVARGMGDWAFNKLHLLSDEARRRMIRNEFGGYNEAMYNLYAITHDERHLWVVRFFYHDERINPLKQGNKDLGTAHANTFIPKLLGECRNYELTGDIASRHAAELLFQTLTRDHAFVTGEVSDKEHLFASDEQNRHLTGYNGENCCTYNLLKLADRLFTYNPSSEIADYYERALYNHILGQQDPETSMVCYFTPLQTGAYRLYSTRDSSFWCCVGSGFESHAKYQSSIYFHSDDVLYVNLFIPSVVNWDGTIVRQQTDFPSSGKSTFTIEGGKRPFTIKFRYPYWATWMKINGRKVRADEDGYVAVKWKKKIVVEMGMTLHEETILGDRSRVALMYGPIVLVGEMEKVDHPFSNPHAYNDYYTFDYGQPADVGFHDISQFKELTPLHYESPEGMSVYPFYDMHHHRYVVCWKKKLRNNHHE